MTEREYRYVNEHSISSSLICPICLDILTDAHTHLRCDSAFCRSCLLQLTEPICPICRWAWDEIYPIEYNKTLPKVNRLIRNMLDELLVECLHCHIIRRRGQFEHLCTIKQAQSSFIKGEYFSLLILLLSVVFVYSYRNSLLESAVNRQMDLITNIGIDIDQYLFETISYLIVKFIEYSSMIFLCNFSLWFSLFIYGDRLTSKSTRHMCQKFLETSIIISMIGYSIYN